LFRLAIPPGPFVYFDKYTNIFPITQQPKFPLIS